MQDVFSGTKLEQDSDAREFAAISLKALFACLRNIEIKNIKNNF